MSEVMKLICPTLQLWNSNGQQPRRPTEQLVVMAEDFDRLTAERDALQQRLTAADERADVQSLALLEAVAACDLAMSAIDDDERGANFVQIIAAIKAKAALKPAEGGGAEYRKSCEAAHKALSMQNQRIVAPGQFKCLACGDIHPGSGNLPCPKMSPTA